MALRAPAVYCTWAWVCAAVITDDLIVHSSWVFLSVRHKVSGLLTWHISNLSCHADLAAVEGPDGTAVAVAWLGEVLIALSRSVTAYYVVRSLPQQPRPPAPPAALPASSSRRDPSACSLWEPQHLRTSSSCWLKQCSIDAAGSGADPAIAMKAWQGDGA